MGRKKNEKKHEDDIVRSGIAGAAYETVQRYGEAAKEHLVAYSGVDNENINPDTGLPKELQKSLKSISEQGTNPDYEFQIRQQKAGWAAEVKDAAKTNAENIIKGKKTRKIRHDDLPNTPANHQLYDHVEIDDKGNVIAGTGSQMKFIGASKKDPKGVGNTKRALSKLKSKEFQKYIDNDVKIEVPKNEYKKMIDQLTDDTDKLKEQLDKVKKQGNDEAVAKIEKEIDNLNKLKKNLRPSKLTRKESLEAVDSPGLSTAKSVAGISHKAGIKTAETAAIVGGGVSLVRNIVGVCKGDIETDEATINVIKDTTQSAVMGYGTGAAGTALKGAMQNSSSEYTRALAKTNVAGTIVAVTVSATKTLKKYYSGDIDGTECMEELGEQGTGMIASSMFAVVGQVAIPIPIVGGLIGGMVGYALSSASYGILMESLKDAKLAREERIAIEKACDEHINMIREYRNELDTIIREYLSDNMKIFNDSFLGIKNALAIGDIDWVVESANNITDSFGGDRPFEDFEEFDNKMINGEGFKL